MCRVFIYVYQKYKDTNDDMNLEFRSIKLIKTASDGKNVCAIKPTNDKTAKNVKRRKHLLKSGFFPTSFYNMRSFSSKTVH